MKDKVSNAVSVVCSNTEDTQTIRNSLKSLQIFNDLKEIFHCIVCGFKIMKLCVPIVDLWNAITLS